VIARVAALEKHRLAPGLQKRFEKPTGFKNRNGFIVVQVRAFQIKTVEEIPFAVLIQREKRRSSNSILSLSLRRSSTTRTICSDEVIAIMVIFSFNVLVDIFVCRKM